jgi:hypothetical protein
MQTQADCARRVQLAADHAKGGWYARYYWLMLAENRLTRRLFASMVRQIDALATG